ncbi:Hypothetical predicted protein [Paramuricea clavata]|uniref:Uncharacterized protein n=1 Tax=Paramuricea clavata TaxID=317549 RepID=A0A7D9DYC9_PARCT|nr:Hypothetical predicted protein [Paramuricea clavata]
MLHHWFINTDGNGATIRTILFYRPYNSCKETGPVLLIQFVNVVGNVVTGHANVMSNTKVKDVIGSESTFEYNSTLWENKESFNIEAGQTALDLEETKLPTFWSTSFKELCIGMKVGNDLNFLSFSYPASSLYTLFADRIYRSTNITRGEWKSLLAGSSLQTGCRKQGFNVDSHFVDVRLGYIGNEQNDCLSTDSYIGIGSNSGKNTWCHSQRSKTHVNIAGNFAGCSADNGNVDITAMAYLLVR